MVVVLRTVVEAELDVAVLLWTTACSGASDQAHLIMTYTPLRG